MPRTRRISVPGAIHHVYNRGTNKANIFYVSDDYHRFLTRLQDLVRDLDIGISSWVLMPNHFHLLLRVNNTPLSVFMSRLLTSYAMYFNKKYDHVGSVFQNRYGSRLVEEEPYFMHVSRYIHLNPLHAGLTHDPRNYPYSSLSELLGKTRWSILKEEEVCRLIGDDDQAINRYQQFILDGAHTDVAEWDPFNKSKEIIGSSSFTTRYIRKHVRKKTEKIKRGSYGLL